MDELVLVGKDVVEGTAARLRAGITGAKTRWGELEFKAVLRVLRKEEPGFER